MTNAARSRIVRRTVDSQWHTQGYVLTGNRRVTRAEAVRMARQDRISGVRVINAQTPYLQSTNGTRLSELPVAN